MLSFSDIKNNPIGVFDSGLGGISVLRVLRERMPYESYIYYSDKKNAPYGKKSNDEIFAATEFAIRRLVTIGCKAVIIACNTATAVAATELRKTFSVPIIGIEPALKPAKIKYPSGNILVLATPVTLRCDKFLKLIDLLGSDGVYPCALAELVSFIENDRLNSSSAFEYLQTELGRFNNIRFDACVLGCTHFPFAKQQISKALTYTPEYFDGAYGVALKLKNELESLGLLCEMQSPGVVLWNEIYPFDTQNNLLYSI